MSAQHTPGPWEAVKRNTQTHSGTTVWLVRRWNGDCVEYLRSPGARRVAKFRSEQAAHAAIAKAGGAA